MPNPKFLCHLAWSTDSFKTNKWYRVKNTPKSLKKAISRPKNPNSHFQIMLWLDVLLRVPHGKNNPQKGNNCNKMPFFVAI